MPVAADALIPDPVRSIMTARPRIAVCMLFVDFEHVVEKLRTDLQTLETELQTLAAKSGVTIGDLQNLTNDSQAIRKPGFSFQASTLNPVISELAVAVAGRNVHKPGPDRLQRALRTVRASRQPRSRAHSTIW